MPSIPVVVPGHSCECGVCRKVLCFHLEGIKFSIATYIHYNYTYKCLYRSAKMFGHSILFMWRRCYHINVTAVLACYTCATFHSLLFSTLRLAWSPFIGMPGLFAWCICCSTVLDGQEGGMWGEYHIIIIVYKIIILMYNRGYNRLCILTLLMHLKSTGIIK